MRTVLFFRNFRKFHGGHLKVWDYFNHVRASPDFDARIGFSKKSAWGPDNPWSEAEQQIASDWKSMHPSAFFVAGRDWRMMDRHPDAGPDIPVINLVQSVRHADPNGTRFEFLSRKAIRICVSEVIADAVRETGLTEGPLMAIPNSIDLERLPADNGTPRDIAVLIAALKQPELGTALGNRLEQAGDRRVEVLSDLVPRPEFLDHMQRARVTVFLPLPTEGFYMPPLEGMALGTLVVCPEHEGERAIYRHGENCFRPTYRLEGLEQAARAALALSPDAAQRMRGNARQTAEEHSLVVERRTFLEVLHNVDQLW